MGIFRRKRRQELWCHDCEHYVQFVMDLAADGNHVLNCPHCGHEHCRVVKNGVITDIRWDQRNGPTIQIPRGYTASTTYQVYTASTMTFVMATNNFVYATGGSGGSGGT